VRGAELAEMFVHAPQEVELVTDCDVPMRQLAVRDRAEHQPFSQRNGLRQAPDDLYRAIHWRYVGLFNVQVQAELLMSECASDALEAEPDLPSELLLSSEVWCAQDLGQ